MIMVNLEYFVNNTYTNPTDLGISNVVQVYLRGTYCLYQE